MQTSLHRLITGYQQFHQQYFNEGHSLFESLSREGQRPQVAIVACSDSRVDPAIILGAKPGDVFVVRNVANLVPPYEQDNGYHGTSAALEFAVLQLEVQHIIILGHSQCGGIRSLLGPTPPTLPAHGFIHKWMELATMARTATLAQCQHHTLDEQLHHCGQLALMHSLSNLQSFPWIQAKRTLGTLALHAWYFDITTGVIERFDEDTRTFTPL